MNLVILSQYYPPEVGAPQNRLSELARLMVEKGDSVTVLTAMPNYPTGKIYPGFGGLFRSERLNGVDIVRTFIYPTQKTDFLRRLTNYFSFVISSAVLGTFLLKPADVLLVESPPLFLGLSAVWLSFVKRARLIFNVSDLWPESAVQLGIVRRNSLLHTLSSWLESFCYRRAWLVTGQSKSIINDIRQRFPNCQTYHLSNGVDTKRFAVAGNDRAHHDLNANGGCVVMYAGLHGIAQGLDQVLKAAEDLSEDQRFRFVLIGDGPEKKMLMGQAAMRGITNVEFQDPRRSEEIPALIAGCDIVLVPLTSYLLGAVPSKLYEAMASGRPIILVASGEASQIVNEHQAGITVEPGDIKCLVQALRTLLAQPQLRRTLGENGRRAARQHFDREVIVSRYREFLKQKLPVAKF
jgi:glycosyltransferase involved in cell wall biosynthesis